jgi:photosystem II stability/assembly factor-like uncharacterized protein
LRTNNDGASYTALSLPPIKAAQGNPTGTLRLLVFASDRVGYALEGREWITQLYATLDGGHSWHRLSLPHGVDIDSVAGTSNALYAITSHCTKQSNGNWVCLHYQLMHSSLTLHAWLSTPIAVGRYPDNAFVGPVSAFGNRLWMTRMGFPKSPDRADETLLRSNDEGETLTTSPETKLDFVNGCNLTAMSINDLWAECPTGMQVSFFYSSDAGAVWNTVPTNQYMGTGGGNFAPLNGSVAYLDYGPFGPKPDLYRVTNDGRTLTAVGELRCTNVSSLVFINLDDGLALCGTNLNATLERTSDGGKHWSRVAVG